MEKVGNCFVIKSFFYICLAECGSSIYKSAFITVPYSLVIVAIIFLILLYYLVRTYIYTMIVTFDMPIRKIAASITIINASQTIMNTVLRVDFFFSFKCR